MPMSADKDREIGQELFVKLHRLVQHLAKRHQIAPHTAADFLLAGALLTAADIYDLSIDDTLEMAQEIGESIQHDTLKPETRQ